MPASNAYKTEIVRSLFQELDAVSLGSVCADFACAHGSYSTGRMYICTNGVCFYSNLFGFEKKLYVLWRDIVHVQMYRASSVLIVMRRRIDDDGNNYDDDNHDEYVFKSFANRDEVLESLNRFNTNSIRGSDSAIGSSDIYDNDHSMIEKDTTSFTDYSRRSEMTSILDESIEDVREINYQYQSQSVTNNNTGFVDNKEMERPTSSSSLSLEKLEQSSSPPPSQFLSLYDGTNENMLLEQTTPPDLSKAWKDFKSQSESSFKYVAVKSAELPVYTLDSFYTIFLDDNAEHSMSSLHNQIGDTVKEITKWKLSPDSFCRTRVIHLDHPVIGYGNAQTSKHQCCRVFGESGISVDSVVTSKGLPAVDCFHVEERIFIEVNADSGLIFTALYQVVWKKSSMLKSVATRSAKKGTIHFYEKFVEMINKSADLSDLPSAIVHLQKEHEDEIQQSEKTRNMLCLVLATVILLFICLAGVYKKVNDLEMELTYIEKEMELLRNSIIPYNNMSNNDDNRTCPDSMIL